MGRRVDIDDLVDSEQVAELLNLANRNAVSVYLARYDDFPRPVVRGSAGRCQYWLRDEVEAWAADRSGSK